MVQRSHWRLRTRSTIHYYCRLGNLCNCVAMDLYLLLGHGLGCCQLVIQIATGLGIEMFFVEFFCSKLCEKQPCSKIEPKGY